ncbi:unnamed protein product [Musa textilis]
MMKMTGLIAAHVGTLGYSAGAYWRMSSLIDSLTECWMIDDTLLLNNDSVVLVACLVLRLETPRMSCISTLLFDTGLIGLEVSDLAQPIIESDNQPYEGN